MQQRQYCFCVCTKQTKKDFETVEAVARRCSVKKVLLEISQNS